MDHEFGVEFQRGVLRLMLVDEPFTQRAFEHIDAGFFSLEALGWIFSRFHAHWKEYLSRPSEIRLRQDLRRCSADKAELYGPEVDMVLNVPASDGAYIKERLLEFVRVNVFAEAHNTSSDLFNARRYVDAFDAMRRAMDRIAQIEFEKPQRAFFFEELPQRQERRARHANDLARTPWMTGIPHLDQRTHGGVQEGELWAILGYPKRGKSTWLANQGFHATRILRQPTLHIQLEGKPEQIEDKYDTLFAFEQYTQVRKGNITASVYADMVNEYQQLRRKLVIRTINSWDVTAEHVLAELEKLRAEGFVPTRLIIDYMDLLRSRNKNARDEMTHQLDSAHDLKRLVTDRGIGCWSAWQAQRPEKGALLKESILYAAQVADCYAKVRIVDAYGSLNSTEDELQKGIVRVYWEGYRDALVGHLYRVQSDLGTLRMFTDVEEMMLPAA